MFFVVLCVFFLIGAYLAHRLAEAHYHRTLDDYSRVLNEQRAAQVKYHESLMALASAIAAKPEDDTP